MVDLNGRSRRSLSLLLIALTVLAGSSSVVAQNSSPASFTAEPLHPAHVFELNTTKDGAPAHPNTTGQDATNLVSVIVKLAVVPLASYRGGLPGLAATSPE